MAMGGCNVWARLAVHWRFRSVTWPVLRTGRGGIDDAPFRRSQGGPIIGLHRVFSAMAKGIGDPASKHFYADFSRCTLLHADEAEWVWRDKTAGHDPHHMRLRRTILLDPRSIAWIRH
jgi:hypothetical protein